MRRGLLAACGAALLCVPALAQPTPPSPQSAPNAAPAAGVLARRGATQLTEAALRELIEREPAEAREALLRDPAALSQYVRQRMLRLTLQEEARSNRFEQRPEVIQRAEQARQDAIIDAYLESLSRVEPGFPSDAEVTAVYDANRARFLVPRQYRIAQIFLAVPTGANAAADAEAQRKLREWRGQATAARNRVEFTELVRRHSEDRARNAPVEWTREDRLIPQVRDAVAGLEEGAVSEPVRSPEGWHLLKVEGTRPAAPAPLAEVREQIVAALRQTRQNELARAAVNDLLRREAIQVDEIALGRIAQQQQARPAR